MSTPKSCFKCGSFESVDYDVSDKLLGQSTAKHLRSQTHCCHKCYMFWHSTETTVSPKSSLHFEYMQYNPRS